MTAPRGLPVVIGEAETARRAVLAIGILVFASPELSAVSGGHASYLFVTVVFTLSIVAVVITWPARRQGAPIELTHTAKASIAAVAAASILTVAILRWTKLMAWQPYGADMLIAIREATRRLLSGRTPYATYRAYDAPWDMAMPYGPALWAPYLVPQLLRLDFRVITITGELFVPIWCGVAATIDAARGRAGAAIAALALAAAFVAALDFQQFTLIGHTPVYWPLLLLFALMIARGRWIEAAFLLGILVAARQTIVATVPVFLMGAWRTDRRRFPAVLIATTIAAGAALLPFVLWDPRAIWNSMVLSYPRVMKAAVWPVLARPGAETIGVTEWLIEQRREWLITPVQILALTAVYAAAWIAIARGRDALPWMALALFAFSMTTLYPVHYLYYDVLVILVSGVVAGTLDTIPPRLLIVSWMVSLLALAGLVLVALRSMAPPFPSIDASQVSDNRPFRAGFAHSERGGDRFFSWVVGNEARIVLPRSSTASADIIITAQPPFERDQTPQRMTAMLNGALIGEMTIQPGWQTIRLAAPSSAWWVGFNELRLLFGSTISPREAGAGEDRRPLALAVSRVEVVEKK